MKEDIWCFYCDREFVNEKVLVEHQKEKHLKCHECGRRLATAGGLVIHTDKVHKVQCTKVYNALPGRGSVEFEVFGMKGIPQKFIDMRKGASQRPWNCAREAVPLHLSPRAPDPSFLLT